MKHLMMFPEKYIEPERAAAAVKEWRASGSVVLALGCFDLLHVGCVRFLKEAAKYGEKLIVGVFDDATVTAMRGSERPVLVLHHRLDMVAAIEGVHAVLPISMEGLSNRVVEIGADFVVVGRDHQEVEACTPPAHWNQYSLVIAGGISEICSDWLVRRIQGKDGAAARI